MNAADERRRLPVAERRETIVEAAGRLFGERGYDGARLDDVAAAAGVTKPVLYRHFDSKLFRDTGGGPEVRALRGRVHARARDVLAGVIQSLGDGKVPAREIEPLAELLSMGMASLVLWWMEEGTASREDLIGAMARVWIGLLEPPAPTP